MAGVQGTHRGYESDPSTGDALGLAPGPHRGRGGDDVHGGALGWVGMVSFAMLYFIVPRIWKRELYSQDLATAHFWMATIGIVLYLVSMWTAGITQWSMWRAIDENGQLVYPQFIDSVIQLIPFYWVRFGAGLLYLSGTLLMGFNLTRTALSPESRSAYVTNA
jgi:cytochrome c oxidase cbb3-type subunit I/II